MITYILQCTLIWALGLLIHRLMLRPLAAHRFNRFYLLALVCSGLIAPLLPEWSSTPAVLPSLERSLEIWLPGVVVKADGEPVADGFGWFGLLYGMGSGLALGWMALGVYRISKLYKTSSRVEYAGAAFHMEVRVSPLAKTAFSFFNTLFLADWNELSDRDQESLLIHESTHYLQRHWVDNLLLGILQLAAWWHPLVYVLRREMRLVHEYEADAAALASIDQHSYRQLLLRQQLKVPALPLITAFSQSPLQNRFTMMTCAFRQNQSWRLALAAFALLFVAVACSKDSIDDDNLQELSNLNQEALSSETDAKTLHEIKVVGTFQGRDVKVAVDTIFTYDPDSDLETMTAIHHIIDKATLEKLKQFQEDLGTRKKGELNFQTDEEKSSKLKQRVRDQEVFKVVDQMPMFPGAGCAPGDKTCAERALLEFIYMNVKYPKAAKDAGVQGTAVVNFVIGTDGEILEPKVVRNPHPDIEAEVLRIISLMPAWIPGQQNGRPVQVSFNLPIKFKLD